MQKYLIFLLLLALLGCSKDSPPASKNISPPKLLWKSPLTDTELSVSIVPIFSKNKVFYSRDFISLTQEPILAMNTETGEKLWEWKDYLRDPDVLSSYSRGYIYNNLFAFSSGTRVYVVNIDTGETVWQFWEKYSGGYHLSGIDNNIFHIETTQDKTTYLSKCDLTTGKWKEIYSTPWKDGYIPRFRAPTPYITPQQDTLLVFTNNIYHFEKNEALCRLLCYNLTQDRLQYDILMISPDDEGSTTPNLPIVYQEKVYTTAGRFIVCHDVYDGTPLWSREFNHNFAFSGIVVAEDKVFGNCENRTLYALDAHTGNEIWRTESSGTSSNMSYHKGYIYFIGGGDGLLHAVDAQTGEHVWKEPSPDLEIYHGASFMTVLSLDPATDKIYTASYLNALCFEAIH